MGRPKKTRYLEPEDLARELMKSMPPNPPTEELCRMLRSIAEHMCGDPRYVGYSKEMHEDMCSAALIKCLKNVKNFDPAKGASSFNYFSRCCEHAFWYELSKYYRQKNVQRQMLLDYADKIQAVSPKLAQEIRDAQIRPGRTGEKARRGT